MKFLLSGLLPEIFKNNYGKVRFECFIEFYLNLIPKILKSEFYLQHT